MNAKSDITFRRATEADNAFVYGLKRLTIGPYVEATWGWDEDTQRKLHADRFVPDGMDLLLVDQEPIGLWRVRYLKDEMVLVSVYLLPAWQSKGIGSSLLTGLVDESTSRQLPIRLQVLRVNTRAKTFYERFGFDVVDATETHFIMRRMP